MNYCHKCGAVYAPWTPHVCEEGCCGGMPVVDVCERRDEENGDKDMDEEK